MSESETKPFTAAAEDRASEWATDVGRRRGLDAPHLDQSFWEQRWRTVDSTPTPATVEPNRTLSAVAADLAPGSALDAGCGQGGDAIWLAQRGWNVTAVDFAASALSRGRSMADRFDDDVAKRIDWHQTDLNTWMPPPQSFDLVTAHYLHGVARRAELFRALAAAVRPHGTLLIVGHHPSNVDITGGTMPMAVFFTSVEVTAVLGGEWDVIRTDDDVARKVVSKDGQTITLRSSLTHARRR